MKYKVTLIRCGHTITEEVEADNDTEAKRIAEDRVEDGYTARDTKVIG